MWRDARQRLKLRQLELQLRSAELRLGLLHDAEAFERPMRWADRGQALWRLAGSMPRLWRTVAAMAAAGGLAGLMRRFNRRDGDAEEGSERSPGRVARIWAWVSLGWKVWRWLKPDGEPSSPAAASTPTAASSASSAPTATTATTSAAAPASGAHGETPSR
ncbi:MAG: hypothetical protein J7598_04575 [Mitsuaria chitosanitabida]|jgi:hypothetical protein|uniref:hypothetical protein n=1 Tax=Roseateles chitosanitabidus TaxID=65048 RepID=UPI001B137E3D|nr:hypothetical protein [Roseateles chitosanitabidus]MBO9685866.1 hypothetical protein [Roseateles chitosanitabidus]